MASIVKFTTLISSLREHRSLSRRVSPSRLAALSTSIPTAAVALSRGPDAVVATSRTPSKGWLSQQLLARTSSSESRVDRDVVDRVAAGDLPAPSPLSAVVALLARRACFAAAARGSSRSHEDRRPAGPSPPASATRRSSRSHEVGARTGSPSLDALDAFDQADSAERGSSRPGEDTSSRSGSPFPLGALDAFEPTDSADGDSSRSHEDSPRIGPALSSAPTAGPDAPDADVEIDSSDCSAAASAEAFSRVDTPPQIARLRSVLVDCSAELRNSALSQVGRSSDGASSPWDSELDGSLVQGLPAPIGAIAPSSSATRQSKTEAPCDLLGALLRVANTEAPEQDHRGHDIPLRSVRVRALLPTHCPMPERSTRVVVERMESLAELSPPVVSSDRVGGHWPGNFADFGPFGAIFAMPTGLQPVADGPALPGLFDDFTAFAPIDGRRETVLDASRVGDLLVKAPMVGSAATTESAPIVTPPPADRAAGMHEAPAAASSAATARSASGEVERLPESPSRDLTPSTGDDSSAPGVGPGVYSDDRTSFPVWYGREPSNSEDWGSFGGVPSLRRAFTFERRDQGMDAMRREILRLHRRVESKDRELEEKEEALRCKDQEIERLLEDLAWKDEELVWKDELLVEVNEEVERLENA
ncbi:MAG: hypothetical protein M1838_005951 [Thelocarpon superellum]|nr:MAG: hypothetical protein M1838_005951 [Thelocarpon superellum]